MVQKIIKSDNQLDWFGWLKFSIKCSNISSVELVSAKLDFLPNWF